MRRLAAGLVWLAVAALAATGCVTLTPAQEHAAAEVRAMADETARVYGVSRISVLVGSNMRPYPGRWTATVWVDEAPAGACSFSLAH